MFFFLPQRKLFQSYSPEIFSSKKESQKQKHNWKKKGSDSYQTKGLTEHFTWQFLQDCQKSSLIIDCNFDLGRQLLHLASNTQTGVHSNITHVLAL